MSRIANGNLPLPPIGGDKSKDWQLEILMEKLRSKASQYKSLAEISKNVRMTMLDKRYALDSVEKSQHQKCLDTLQHSIKVTSLQSMVERLESLTRQLGLKFMVGPSGVELFISSDMFYLEIVLDESGAVNDVKVHHEGKSEQQSCQELVSCLSRGDFQDFTAQLEGFASIYQLNAEKKIKSKAFIALQSLESDLSTLAQLQSFMKEPFNLIHKSPVGILEKRKGGHPMKLTYFVSPYDLIDSEKGEIDPINIDIITSKSLGYSVTVCVEGSAAHKLQTTTLITVSRNINGKSSPSFSQLGSQNSAVIPASFALKLNKPIPMCVSLVRQLQTITELEWADLSNPQPLLGLIVNQASEGKLQSGSNKGLFVTLPDQNHCYFMTENKNMEGVLVHSIPFTHPAKVSQILVMLRQQALFNTIVGSCVRPDSRQDFENMTLFEVSALSWNHISISLEHPTEESMATAEIDLSEISKLTCKIHTPGTPPPQNTSDIASELASKILNKCFSIPVTMRAIIKLWERQAVRRTHFNGHENFSLPLDSCDPGGHKGGPGGGLAEFEGLDCKIKQESSLNGNMMMQQHHNLFLNESMMANANFSNFPPSEGVLSNLELTNILSGGSQGEKSTKRQHKRKASDDNWRSSKRKAGEETEILLETSSSDSTSRSTPFSQEAEVATPNSALGFQSDLELSSLDPTELLATQDKSQDFVGAIDDLEGVEEMLSDVVQKEKITSNLSITPITSGEGFREEPLATNTITITPIVSGKAEDRSKERRREDRGKPEKKRKKRRDESPMGPPEKIPSTKPPTESPPLSTPQSPNMVKYNASPTQNRNLSGKSSPNLIRPIIKGNSHQSPKHSPAHVPSSPKHIAGISSPKNHGTSPKHSSTSGSGKPSMSTLKSAANSPKSDKIKSSSKDLTGGRDKEKKSFSVGNAKIKPATVKVKALDLSDSQDGVPSPSSSSDSKSSGQKSRKGNMLSAIVDKLKSAQHCDLPADLSSKSGSGSKERQISSTKSGDNKTGVKLGENKNSEYMVKPSSDGIKLTINKTRTKDGAKIAKVSGTPKVHTGLKPGVNSGPASKKPQHQSQKSSSPTLKPSTKLSSTSTSNKSSGALKSSSKPSSSPKTSSSATDLSRSKDRPKLNKSSSEKSIFSNKERGKSSPTQKDEVDAPYKFTSTLMMEGLMKQLDKNFQIPKLSARLSDDKKPKPTENLNNVSRNDKIYDLSKPQEVKYPLALPKSIESIEAKIRNNLNNATPINLRKEDDDDRKKARTGESLNLSAKSVDLTSKFLAPPAKDEKRDCEGVAKEGKSVALAFPQSPSVSVHIVKSPAPSPIINPSPHAASPCITDDELMDEALVGLGK